MQQFFELKKLKLFNRIRLNNIAIDMPHYIIHHRLAHSNGNQNKLAMTANLTQPIVRPFGNSFFPSSIALWNASPYSIQCLDSQAEFSRKAREHLWSNIVRTYNLEPD